MKLAIIGVLAILLAGCAIVPIDPFYPGPGPRHHRDRYYDYRPGPGPGYHYDYYGPRDHGGFRR
jgi:hypothetical protein